MENNNGIKGAYLALFISGIISCLLSFILGFILSIGVFIISLIVRSKLPKGESSPIAVKLMFFTSIIQFFSIIILFISAISLAIISDGSEIIFLPLSLLELTMNFLFFIAYAIGSFLVYKEYDKIDL